MPEALTIHIPSFGEVLNLEGDDAAEIDTAGPRPLMRGAFRAVFAAHGRTARSRAETFGPGARRGAVRRRGGRWELVEASLGSFALAAREVFWASPNCPTLAFQRIALQVYDGVPPLAELADLSVSFRPQHDAGSYGALVYPTQAGWRTETLRPISHPAAPGTAGYYLRPDEDGSVAVFAAAPLGGLDIDHSRVVRLFASGNCVVSYRVSAADGAGDGCLRLHAATGEALSLGISRSTGLSIQDTGPVPAEFSWSELETIEARGGRFRDTRFVEPQLRLSRVAGSPATAAEANGTKTSLFGPGGRFDFELDIPEDSGFDPARHTASFVYAHLATAAGTAAATVETDPWERFYGLTVEGVSSTRGRPEIFDLSLGEVRLRPARDEAGEPAFEFAAGGEIPLRGISVVRPKPDRSRGNARVAALATDALRLTLRERAPLAPKTCLEYRSAERRVSFIGPELEGAPAGAAARSASQVRSTEVGEASDFAAWVLDLVGEDGELGRLDLGIDREALSPPLEWLDRFRTKTREFELLEIPGVKITTRGPARGIGGGGDALGTRMKVDFERPDFKETAVYSVASLAAAWYAIPDGILKNLDDFRDKAEAFFDTDDVKVDFDFTEINEKEMRKFVRSRSPDSLQLAYFAEAPGDAGDMRMRAFIDANGGDGPVERDGEEVAKLYMPLDVGLSVVLMDKGRDPDGAKQYASEIIFGQASGDQGAPRMRPTMLFKLGQKGVKESTDSGERLATDYTLLGYTAGEWKRLARENPALWPRAAGAKAGKPDPSDERWFGIFLRHMPVQFVVPPKVRQAIKDRSKLLETLYKAINENLYLRYGWIGPKGATWYVTLLSPDGYDATPEDWRDLVTFRLEGIAVAGAEGKSVGGEATMSLALEKIRGTRISDGAQDEPLKIQGRFAVDVSGGEPITAFELAVTNDIILETNAIPGFDEVALVGMSSDLTTATLKMRLTPSDGLAAALPIFEAGESVIASILLNFGGAPGADFQMSLPTDSETNLFGRFPLTIQGIYLKLGDEGENVLLVRGRLGLGLVGLDAVGADIVLRQTGGGWDFDIFINEISVALTIGDSFEMQGLLSWAPDDAPIEEVFPDPDNPEPYQRAVPSSELAGMGGARNFWGILTLKTGSFLGELSILTKIGTQGERSYWVAAMRTSADLSIGGSAGFENPAIVVAKNADFGTGLRNLLADPYAKNVGGLRPPVGDLGKQRTWLADWKASNEIGTVVAGSGYLNLADGVAESTKGEGERYMTALIGTDAGLFRFDAHAKFLGTSVVGFGIAIDTEEKRLLVALRLPEIATPDKANPKYVLSPGQMSLAVDYGGRAYFLLSIGWPPVIRGSQIERDWTQATRVYIADLFPINSFWGGFRAVLDAEGQIKRVRMGYAIRAGWTWSSELNGADIAKASAELGVTLGGVLEFELTWRSSARGAVALGAIQGTDAGPALPPGTRSLMVRTADSFKRFDAALAAAITESLEIMEAAVALGIEDVAMEATVYGDIWGKGSLEFLGVTLASVEISLRLRIQFCGTLKRGVTRAWGRGEIEVEVEILCVVYKGRAGFDLWLKRGPYPCLPPLRSALAASQPALALTCPCSE